MLIVPYGIETLFQDGKIQFHTVLIVPYGIETITILKQQTINRRVLIVPYGIETLAGRIERTGSKVLIVPYGIETQEKKCSVNVSFLC